MTLTVLVAEDEAPQREALLAMLRGLLPEAAWVPCADGLEALEHLESAAVDLAFLDIRMPGASGLEVAQRVLERGGAVVFTTAYDAHAVQAFEQGAIDYLLKPLQPARVAQAVVRWRQRSTPAATRLDSVLLDLATLAAVLKRQEPPRLRWISASLGDTLRLIGIDEVQGFHAEDKMTRVLTASGDAVIRTTLRELLPQLDPEAFWQVHRSLIVQVSAIDRVRKDELGRHALTLKGRSERFAISPAVLPRLRGT